MSNLFLSHYYEGGREKGIDLKTSCVYFTTCLRHQSALYFDALCATSSAAPSVSLDALELWRSSSRRMDHGGPDRQLCLFFSGTLNLHPISQFVSRCGNLFGFSVNTNAQILWVFVGEILRWSSLYFMREFVLRFCGLQHCINKKGM
jgi:hypothetical protein